MQFSFVGLFVALGIYVLGRQFGGGLVFALLVSLVFGATSFVVLTALGGSSPLIYTLFAVSLLVALFFRRNLLVVLRRVFAAHPISWVILLLLVYVVGGGYIFPRMFMGETIVFVVKRGETGTGGIVAAALAPYTGNLTQSAYFALAALMYFAILAILGDVRGLKTARVAAFGWAIAVAVTGYVDLIAKLVGLGDVLKPIRTANYSMLTSEQHAIAGFPRINGAFSEASAFAAVAVPALVFSILMWRAEKHPGQLFLAIILFVLVVLSTSTTAYATVGICGLWLGLAVGIRMLRGQIAKTDGVLVSLGVLGCAVLLGMYLYKEALFNPFLNMIESMVFNKASSSSAVERGMWNAQALTALMDTQGIGVGIGSTYTSSWLVAVLAQLGIAGSMGIAAILVVIFKGFVGVNVGAADPSIVAVCRACRGAAIATLIAASISSPSADPGVFVFFALATIVASRNVISAGNQPDANAVWAKDGFHEVPRTGSGVVSG